MHVAPTILSSFVTLLVTIGPIETAVVFAGLTAGIHRTERRSLAVRSTTVAGLVLLIFAIAGNFTLGLLHISLPAFRGAGGPAHLPAGVEPDVLGSRLVLDQ
jgi:multiple antibiotic resistance protein